jgi:hypothetical protein
MSVVSAIIMFFFSLTKEVFLFILDISGKEVKHTNPMSTVLLNIHVQLMLQLKALTYTKLAQKEF